MENMKLRCHFSTIFESLWQFWVAIAVILLNQIDEVIDLVREINRSGRGHMGAPFSCPDNSHSAGNTVFTVEKNMDNTGR